MRFVLLALFLFVIAAPSAHAGIYEYVNEAFTFREDQKERVRPKNTLPPVQVITPMYDNEEAQQWSNLYTREDLKPVSPMVGTSSMVMRPNGDTSWKGEEWAYAPQAPQPQGYVSEQPRNPNIAWNAPNPNVQPHPNYPYGYNPNHPPQGYDAMRYRDQMNQWQQQAAQARTFVGEPQGEPDFNGTIGRKTMIDNPRTDWRAGGGDRAFAARPGDFDYKGSYDRLGRVDAENIPARTGDARPGSTQGGKAETYQVQGGDTLSGISGKPQIYNNWKLWPLIHDANRATVKDPDMIRPQQNLTIPRGYTESEARDAEKRAQRRGGWQLNDGK